MIPARDRRLGGIFAAILLLAFMALLSFGAVLHQSPTFDEVAHIGAGLSYVQKLDLRMNPEHPPLAKALTGLALTLRGTKADYAGPAWTNSKDFMFAFLGEWSFGHWVISRWNNPTTVLSWARFPMLLLTLALGWAIFICARRLGGVVAGLICLAVYVSAPIFLVFGPLVLTDIAIALFSVVSVWAFGSLWREPRSANRWLFTLALAGAFLSKFSAPILLLGLFASGLSTRWMPVLDQPSDPGQRKAWRRLRWRATWKCVFWTAVLVYVFYFVFSWNQPTSILERIGSDVPALVLRRLLLPLVLYLGGMFMVLFTASRPSFLFGHVYPHGIWFYYPVVFALKSQLGFLGLLMLSLILGLVRKRRAKSATKAIPLELQMHWRTLWVTLVVFTAVCMLSHFDISVRHFSVPYALLILMVAPMPRLLENMPGMPRMFAYAGRGTVAVLVLSCLISAARTYPWYLPYVNALGAGKPAYVLMSDSNVDWNQSLPEVKQFVERHKLQDLPLDSYALSDDTAYVPQSHVWDCQAPGPADAGHWVVVSANMILDGHNCSWLLRYPQEELGGGSMYAFHLPAEIPPEGAPGGPPRPADRRAFLGTPFDFKALELEALRYPESIPDLTKQLMKTPPGAKN
ncbi:MAG: glycosyltransferase family 39 protein [Bryobacteraceae bacterium]